MTLRISTAIFTAAFIAAGAFASFEELFVVDAGTKSIKRFDPVSGIYLGEFGLGHLGVPRGITYCPDNSVVIIDVTLNGLTTLKKFDADTGLLLANRQFLGAGTLNGLDIGKDGKLYAVEDAGPSNTLKVWGIDLNNLSSQTLYSTTLSASFQARDIAFFRIPSTTLGYICGSSGYLSFNSATHAFGALSPNLDYRYTGDYMSGTINYIAFSAATGANPDGLTGTHLSNARDLAGGHAELFVSGLTSGGSGVIARYDTIGFNSISTFGGGFLTNPTYMTIHNAPEPASFVALGLGLAALLKKRKSR